MSYSVTVKEVIRYDGDGNVIVELSDGQCSLMSVDCAFFKDYLKGLEDD